jgi:AraC family transcriptional regulator
MIFRTPDAVPAPVRRVLDHIDGYPGDDLTLDRLSAVAALSKHHLHRQFTRFCGIGVYEYVRLVRLKHAAWAFRPRHGILEIALRNGYGSHEAFSRAFKQVMGQTPRQFRDAPEWSRLRAADHRLTAARAWGGQSASRLDDVVIIDVADIRVAALEHRGAPEEIGDTLRTFIAWRMRVGMHPRAGATFNIIVNDPIVTPPVRPRFAICAATNRDVADNPYGVTVRTIPGGRCAVRRHVGSDDTLSDAVHHLTTAWLDQVGETRRHVPVYLHRVRLMPDVAERAAVTDIYVPLAPRARERT